MKKILLAFMLAVIPIDAYAKFNLNMLYQIIERNTLNTNDFVLICNDLKTNNLLNVDCQGLPKKELADSIWDSINHKFAPAIHDPFLMDEPYGGGTIEEMREYYSLMSTISFMQVVKTDYENLCEGMKKNWSHVEKCQMPNSCNDTNIDELKERVGLCWRSIPSPAPDASFWIDQWKIEQKQNGKIISFPKNEKNEVFQVCYFPKNFNKTHMLSTIKNNCTENVFKEAMDYLNFEYSYEYFENCLTEFINTL